MLRISPEFCGSSTIAPDVIQETIHFGSLNSVLHSDFD